MSKLAVPMLIALGALLAACQSSAPGGAGTDLRDLETQQQAIERIEREGAQQRYGRGL